MIPGGSKRCRPTKPFWNDDLTKLWNALSDKEKQYLGCRDTHRSLLRQELQDAQRKFAQNYRKAERNYRKNKIIEIENFWSSNPNQFWDNIKKLGPFKKDKIPMGE